MTPAGPIIGRLGTMLYVCARRAWLRNEAMRETRLKKAWNWAFPVLPGESSSSISGLSPLNIGRVVYLTVL